MKRGYKTKNTLKETADSQEDEKEQLKDREESSDSKSQEDPEEEEAEEEGGNTNDTPEIRDIRFGFWQIQKYRKYQMGLMPPPPLTPLSTIREHTPSSSAVAPPFLHHSFQVTSPQFNVINPGSVTMEQGIEPSSLCDRPSASEDSASSTSHINLLCGGLLLESLHPRSEMRQFESHAEHEPRSYFDPSVLHYQGQPPAGCFSSDQRSITLKTTKVSDLLPATPYHDTGWYQAWSRPEDVNVCEPLAKGRKLFSQLLSTVSNKHTVMGQPEESFSRLFNPIQAFAALPPPLNYEVTQTNMEQSRDSLAETNESLPEQLTDHFEEVKEILDLSASEPKTVYYGRRSQSNLFTDYCPQYNSPALDCSPGCSNEEKLEEETSGVFLWGAECNPAVDNTDEAAAPPVRAEYVSATNTLPSSSRLQVSSCRLTRSLSASSLSKIPKNNLRRAASLPDVKLKEFTPAISADGCDDETYRFQCSCPGLYQCSVSGLVFNMKGEGDVLYRTVPWNRRLLAQHHKKPAGPLFDIKCLQQSVCQLHLPHCEIISTGGGRSLQVAHVSDEGIEFISPHQVTETHVVLNISGFSGYGNVKDEDSPPDPVRALVLLFYKPPEDPDLTSFLNVLLLPRNVVLRDVLRTRKKLVGGERYIGTPPHCKLHPKQVYALSTSPEDDSVLVQPTEAEFDEESYENYFPSFQVTLEKVMNSIKLFLRDSSSSHSVWQRKVHLSSCGVKKSCGPTPLNLPPNKRLLNVESSFIDGISGPVLGSLLDKLLEKQVITDAEREAAGETQNRRDRARLVIDTVRRKGEAASSEMIEFLSELDSFFCKNLELI